LANLFGNSRLDNTDVLPIAVRKKKRSLLPLLTVVFLASYGLMTLLIVEQGEAIESQRSLIQALLSDSHELWAMKAKALVAKRAQLQSLSPSAQDPSTRGERATIQTPSTQTPSTQTDANQTPSAQVPLNQDPSSRLQQHSQSRAGKSNRVESQVQENIPDKVPPVPASDLSDQRRALITL
jgi:hypothetical protein